MSKTTLKTVFTATLIALALGVPSAQANDVVVQIPVTTDFADGNFQWTNGKIGYSYRINLIEYNGRLALCGVGIYRDAQLRPAVDNMLRGGKITVDGKVGLKNFRFFNVGSY